MSKKRPEINVNLIVKELNKYTVEVSNKIKKVARKLSKNAISTLKETSPRSNKIGDHYNEGWKTKIVEENGKMEIIIHNKTKPHLTHLLEFGHLCKNGNRVLGQTHIEPVQTQLNKDFEKSVKEILEDGG